jgi:hypothetical protein
MVDVGDDEGVRPGPFDADQSMQERHGVTSARNSDNQGLIQRGSALFDQGIGQMSNKGVHHCLRRIPCL